MALFYESLHALIGQDLIKKVAEVLEEKEANIAKASSSITAGLLGIMAKKGDTPQVKNIFEKAGKLDILSDIGVFDEKLTHPQQEVGDELLEQLLGDKASEFTHPISKAASISNVSANRLISIIAPIVAGFFGKKMVKDGMSFHGIINTIKKEATSFIHLIPNEIVRTFRLTLLPEQPETQAADTQQPEPEEDNLRPRNWASWLITLFVLLVLFFWWRSCQKREAALDDSGIEYSVDTIAALPSNHPATPDKPLESMNEVIAITEIILPNGEHLSVHKNGMEDKISQFLASDEYKKATNKELENKWFEFDDIEFEFGSSTELKEGSEARLSNIISILKAHKDAKVIVAAFSDKRGSESANTQISKERAETIKALLEKGGVGAQVVKTEGYGESQATHPASASEEERGADRDIALRFVK